MMTKKISIGFVRLSDVAPLAVAKTLDMFEPHGLDVTLRPFGSWAAMRDALGTGAITAAHMLAPMVVASAAGLGPFPNEFLTGFIFNLNGNAITVSTSLFNQMSANATGHMQSLPLSASALKTIIHRRKDAGEPPLVFAHVFPYSMHAYELRYWLGAAGINPDTDVQLVVIPPSQMANALACGDIDGFCVGEPWNCVAASSGIGRSLITSYDIWSSSPEKALVVRRSWAEDNHTTHIALIRALLEAAAWTDRPENREQAAKITAARDIINVPLEDVLGSLTGTNRQIAGALRMDIPDFNVFHRYAANFPWHSQAKWILSQMIRWGNAPANIDIDTISKAAFRPGIYREAALELGIACPNADEKIEGAHSHAWLMNDATAPIACGPNRFLDGRTFDPSNTADYIESFHIRHTNQAEQGAAHQNSVMTVTH